LPIEILKERCRCRLPEAFPKDRTLGNAPTGSRERSSEQGSSSIWAILLAAGLPAPQMVAAARVEGGAKTPVYDYIASTLRSLLPIAAEQSPP